MSRERAKGTAFESEVVAYLQANGFPRAERRAGHGNMDRGDITGIPGIVLECKATKTIDWAAAADEAVAECDNAGAAYGAAVIKRRNKPTGSAYVLLDLEQLCALFRELLA